MAHRLDRRSRRPVGLLGGLLAVVVGLLAVAGVSAMLARAPAATETPMRSVVPGASAPAVAATSTLGPSAHPTLRPVESPTASPSAGPSASPTPALTPSPSSGPVQAGAPRSAAEFDVRGQVIEIGFPLRADTRYRYRDNFLDRRAGAPDPYNHARQGTDGRPVRLHDGIDIYARQGEPVLAPFDGEVIDPATRWQPWITGRYGQTVAIVSTEQATAGYTAIMVHLDRAWADPGQVVSRGQVIGVLGKSGNAEGVKAQLHFELRAPFALDWSELGLERMVDAFNPYPSLIEADPNL